jgi:hypothetical protein
VSFRECRWILCQIGLAGIAIEASGTLDVDAKNDREFV